MFKLSLRRGHYILVHPCIPLIVLQKLCYRTALESRNFHFIKYPKLKGSVMLIHGKKTFLQG